MSLLRRNPSQPDSLARAQPVFSMDQIIRLFGGSSSVSKSSVKSIETALSSSIVWRCAMKNAATLASFPVHTYRGRDVIADPRIVANPAGDGSLRSSWVFASALSMYLRGGANYWIEATDQGAGRRASLLHPDRVDWSAARGWTLDSEQVELWPVGSLHHVPLYTMPGIPKGLNPLEYAARALYPGMAAGEFSGNFFQDGAHPSSIIAPENDPGEDGAKALKRRVLDVVEGTNREPIVLPQSVKWHQIQVNPSDSQFIETMRLSDEQVCRYMGTPPEEVGIAPSGGKSMTYANREQRKQDYLQELLFPKGQIEGGWSALIARPQMVKLNSDGLLAADLKTRYESYKVAAEINGLTGGTFLDVDEMRELEDRSPVPGDSDESASARELAEMVQKIYMGVGVVLSADEAREILNSAGASLSGSFSPADRSSLLAELEQRALAIRDSQKPPEWTVHNHPPDVRVEAPITVEVPELKAPIVHVAPPDVRVDVAAPDVNVEAPHVTVEAAPAVERADTPPVVNVTVEPTPVTVENHIETPRSKHKVKRDTKGNIVEIEEKPA